MEEKMFWELKRRFDTPVWKVESVTSVSGRGRGVYNVWFVTRDGRRSMDRYRVWWDEDHKLQTCLA